ncbi:hypothetical protein ABZ801_19990 [Actinomadura sp. NPDC047616]
MPRRARRGGLRLAVPLLDEPAGHTLLLDDLNTLRGRPLDASAL